MKILRDETGQVLLGLATDTQAAATNHQPTARSGERMAPTSAARPTQHCCFHCHYCDALISLPHDKLGLAFAAPALRRTDLRAIAAVCGACHHVGIYSLFRGTHGYDTRHNLALMPAAGEAVLVDVLHCNEETCAHPLPLFVTADGALTGDVVKDDGKGWDWSELTCAAGHRVRRPGWLYDTRPLNFPAPLK